MGALVFLVGIGLIYMIRRDNKKEDEIKSLHSSIESLENTVSDAFDRTDDDPRLW